MERSIQKNGLVNLLALLAGGAAAFATARYANSLAGLIASVFLGLGVLVAFVSWFQMRLEEAERLERFELEELARSKASVTLFEGKEGETFTAQRARLQFDRFFIPIFTVLLFLLQAGGAYLFWRWLDKSTTAVALRQPMVAMPLFGLFFLVLFLLGRFSATIARLEGHRLLRPGASYLLLCAYLNLVAAAAIAGVQAGFPRSDFYVARILCGMLALNAAETLVTLILEIYRPRVKGKVERPLYESRLVGLLAQPEGLITTVAEALDYQFGFKVSETWFYRFLARHFSSLVVAQLGVLLLSTCFVFIDAGEQALLERFGRPVEGRAVLGPGPHLKWPWPVDKIYRYRTERIQILDVGSAPNEEEEKLQTILWAVNHGPEDNFLVANREQPTVESAADEGVRKAPPVSLLTADIPLQFQIRDLTAWAYNNEDPAALLQRIGAREVTRYLLRADMNEIMSRKRLEATHLLRDRIQAAADADKLGVNILFVGVVDIHPPVSVAGDFEKVVGAIQEKKAKILAAQAYDIRTNALAVADAFTLTNNAEAERRRLEVNALARAALFTNQIPAFEAAPSVYKQRAYFQNFARATANSRKYILLVTNTRDVIVFDLQDKIREDLLNAISVTPQQPKAKESP